MQRESAAFGCEAANGRELAVVRERDVKEGSGSDGADMHSSRGGSAHSTSLQGGRLPRRLSFVAIKVGCSMYPTGRSYKNRRRNILQIC